MLTFDMGERHDEFSLFNDHESFPSSLPCYGHEVVISIKFMELVRA